MKKYVLVSQGIAIYETCDKDEAYNYAQKSNEEFYEYKQVCLDAGERYADNEIEVFEEEMKKDDPFLLKKTNDAIFLPGKIHGTEHELYVIYYNPDSELGSWEIEILTPDKILNLYNEVKGNSEEFFGLLPDYFHGCWKYADGNTEYAQELCNSYDSADFVLGKDGSMDDEMLFIVDWAAGLSDIKPFAFTDAQYNLLEKISHDTKMDCWFWIKQTDSGVDYIFDLEKDSHMPLNIGISQLFEGVIDTTFDSLTENEKNVFKELCDIFSIKTDLLDVTI